MRRRSILRLFGASAIAVASRSALSNAQDASRKVTIIPVTPKGELLPAIVVDKITKTDDEWKAALSPLSYQVTRREGTERPYSGAYWKLEDAGIYSCIGCSTALFNSKTKFDSHTGWPSFWAPISKHNIAEKNDFRGFEPRIAVACARCDAHLGHVFEDGPRPTGLRYCLNSVSLLFIKSS
jgi:peptide-methionine (R)-S-oxide reductase